MADALDPLLVNDAALRHDVGMGMKQIQRFRVALAAAKSGHQLVASPMSGGSGGGEAAANTARQRSVVEDDEKVGEANSNEDAEMAAEAREQAMRVANLRQWEEEYDVAAAVAALKPPTPVSSQTAATLNEPRETIDDGGFEPLTAGANLSLRPPSAFTVMSLQVKLRFTCRPC